MPQAREVFSLGLRSMMLNLRDARAAMRWLAATQSPQINLGGLYLAEELTDCLIGKDADLVAVPDDEYMYSIEAWPFRQVIDNTIGFSGKTDRWPVILRYPLGDGHRLLLHALFGHELAHSAVTKYGMAASLAKEITEQDTYIGRLKPVVAEVWESNAADQTERTLASWLEGWLEELFCDHLAGVLLGPAYVWAFAAFVLPLSYDEPSSSYPPNTIRVRLLMELMRSLGWEQFLRDTSPEIHEWLDEVGKDPVVTEEAQFGFLAEAAVEAGPRLRQLSEEKIGDSALAPSAEGPALKVVELLDELVLPVGESPFQPREILLGGWRRALKKHSGGPSMLPAALADRQMHDLVGKAIEMSVVVSSWESS
jgi:hypothetical protein